MTAWGLDLIPILVAAGATILVAVAGAVLTDLGPWYRQLVQPRWKPPDWAFGPIWTVVFTCAATAGVLAWNSAPDASSRTWLLALFALNGVLNMLWSLLYFRLHRPDWSLAELVLLWLSVLWLMVEMAPYSPRSSWLLTPYLVWVATAGFLNFTTIRLNGPFGKR
jgi:benzodiazapine receptor